MRAWSLLPRSPLAPAGWALLAMAVFWADGAAAQLGGPQVTRGASGEHSVARQWNEATLEAIRNDLARPPVHARNLFHVAAAMYDAWAAYDGVAAPYFLGSPAGGTACSFDGVPVPADMQSAREEAISFAAHRLLSHRFLNSPGALLTLPRLDSLLTALGYDPGITGTDYASGSPAGLGNYVAACVIAAGLADGANELENYDYLHYEALNPPLILAEPGNPSILDLNRWQPLTFELYIDQSGNVFPGGTPKFIGPEWGAVRTFALTDEDLTVRQRGGVDWNVYHDPGAPPMLDVASGGGLSAEYQWGFALVAAWGSHLDPSDGVMWDISPASIGNHPELPAAFQDYPNFYDLASGATPGAGHAVNPRTGLPYEPQIVPRGDYTRVLAEFWADGPDSETPPGHWFTILNYVNDHPLAHRRFAGDGPDLDPLEWDVKAYFALGGAAHDAAISAWSIKGWYDYVRPISAIRAMAELGQSTDAGSPSYHPGGLPLIDGFIEQIAPDDPLAGDGEHVGKLKLYTWRGHEYIENPDEDEAGVGWIRAEEWWPFQRITFVTPPFAGYVSGHSTYSRASAEVLTLLTGDAFFPGGIGEFFAPKDVYLETELGPSVDVTLQWATYRDAASECSLSRIWGGIHPPADDIPGRVIGERVGTAAFLLAERYFAGDVPTSTNPAPGTAPLARGTAFPNPASRGAEVTLAIEGIVPTTVEVFDALGRRVHRAAASGAAQLRISTAGLTAGAYFVRVSGASGVVILPITVLR